jgi:sensor histidine kinase YesM
VLCIIGAVWLDSEIDATDEGLSYLTISMVSCSLFSYIWLHLKFVRDHEDALMMEQRVQIMLTQIRPHFLYNSLTVIQDLCRTDPAQAEIATLQFAKYLRGNMDALQNNAPIPFTEELEHTKEYLALEKMRFEDKLTVRYDIQCETFSLPTLTLEPIVENAVRYGVRGNSSGRGEVAIATREYPDRYEITVNDNGPGFDPEAPLKEDGRSHIGVRNVRDRLDKMCGGTLTIQSAPGKGTCVTITIPKGENAP